MLCFCCTLIICMGHSKLERIILLHFLLDLTLLWLSVILFHEVCHILRDCPWSHANKVLYNSALHVYFFICGHKKCNLHDCTCNVFVETTSNYSCGSLRETIYSTSLIEFYVGLIVASICTSGVTSVGVSTYIFHISILSRIILQII